MASLVWDGRGAEKEETLSPQVWCLILEYLRALHNWTQGSEREWTGRGSGAKLLNAL